MKFEMVNNAPYSTFQLLLFRKIPSHLLIMKLTSMGLRIQMELKGIKIM